MFSHDSGRVDSGDSEGKTFGDCAVLYRTNVQSRSIIEAFERSGIPYEVSGEKQLAEYDFVRNVTVFLKTASGENVDLESAALLTKSFGVRKKDPAWKELLTKAGQVLQNNGLEPAIGTLAQWPGFQTLIEKEKETKDLFGRLMRIASLNNNLQSFVDYIQLQQSDDSLERRAEKVSLLTLHAAKGLEFPVVFIAGCEDGLVPLVREGKYFDPAEERRLFYVGMTRAKELLYLTSARRRTMYGKTNEARPSPFLADIKEELKTYEKAMKNKAAKKAESEQISFMGELFEG
jgi:superfamily I DNA/RNA helicase